MSRNYDDWISAYLKYNEKTESAVVFHKWAAISTIASVLRRKAHFRFGRIKIHPNLYIVFVAEPGVARKTQAITFSEEFLTNIYGVHIAADSTTPEALLNAIQNAADDAQMMDGTQLRHCSLTICSGEFESFLKTKKENSRMVTILTDLFDCKSRPFTHQTKHSGSNELPLPFLNILAAITPSSLAECFSSAAIGGGLSTRIMFVCADGIEKKVDIPELDEERLSMFDPLFEDLNSISQISGEYNYSKAGRKWWKDFYRSFEMRDPNRLCKDPSFVGWYSRKPLLLLKIATVVAASKSSRMEVTDENFEEALFYIHEVEPKMGDAFTGVGRSDIATDIDMVRKLIKHHGAISEKHLRQLVWRDIDDKKFESVTATLTKAGFEVYSQFSGPKDQGGLWFYWRETYPQRKKKGKENA